MSAAAVSVVIPTLNGATTIAAVLDAVAGQQHEPRPEVVAVDSGSTDGTLDLLDGRVDRLLHVSPEKFDHGGTRNLGIDASRGELVVLLVQDAIPADPRWLAELCAPLAADPGVAGSFARQRPRPSASRLARHALERWVASGTEPFVSRLASPDELAAMDPARRHLRCAFDNVCSCLRRDVWRRHPLPRTSFAEDLEWARTVLLAGWGLAYAPAAEVLHSHDRPVAEELARTRLAHRRLGELFGLRTIPTAGSLVRAIATTLPDHLRCVAAGPGPAPGPREVARALALSVAWPLGQYLGGRDAARAAA